MTPEQKAEARALWERGDGSKEIAAALGTTKNVIIGLAQRGKWGERRHDPTTLFERCDALKAKMDAVLKETVGIGRLPNEPRRL